MIEKIECDILTFNQTIRKDIRENERNLIIKKKMNKLYNGERYEFANIESTRYTKQDEKIYIYI